MPVWIKANESNATRRRIYFDLRSSVDAITPATSESGGVPQISINGSGWTTTGVSALTHIGNGRYYAELTLAAVANAGDRIETRYKSANTIETSGDIVQVVGFDPFDSNRLGLAVLPVAPPGVVNGLPVVDLDGRVAADVFALLGTTLTENTAAAVAGNFSKFFDVEPVTTQTVNDVGGGGGSNWSTTEKEQIRHRLGIDGDAQGPSATPSLASAVALAAVATDVTAVRAKTDGLTFTTEGLVDARVQAVGETAVTGPNDLKATAVQVASFASEALAELFTTDSGTTYGSAVAGSVVAEIVANSGGSAPTDVAAAVWNASLDTYQQTESMGLAMGQAVAMGVQGSVNDPGASATAFRGDNSLSAVNDYYTSALLVFLSGPNQGQARPIASYSGATRAFGFVHPFPAAPADGDRFRITGYAASN